MIKDGLKNTYHLKSAEDVLTILDSEITGLSDEEAKLRLGKFGSNEIISKSKNHIIFTFIKQFNSPMYYILMLAAGISYLFGKLLDFYVILAVILANAIIGFIQEYRAEKSIEALKKMIISTAKVYRNGELTEIDTSEVVPGDILVLEEGDKISADARIIEHKNLRTQEASLTGESYPVNKHAIVLTKDVSVADQSNMVWMGTFAVAGEARAIVTSTGDDTFLGQIATSLGNIKQQKWNFEIKTEKLAKQLAIISFTAAFIVFLVGYFIRDFSFQDIFLFAIAALVASIPEGLPAVITIVLAIGAHRMAKRNAITRVLPSTETLSVVNAIITDKTGTLTQNTINVERVILSGQEEIKVTGDGWKPHGEFHQNQEIIIPLDNYHLSKMLHIICLCNNARVIKEEDKGADEYKIIGDPTEASLAVLAEKAGIKEEVLSEFQQKINDLPFSSENKYRASLINFSKEKNRKELYVVGAPEYLIKKSTCFLEKNKCKKASQKDIKFLLDKVEELASRGMRTVAIAYKDMSKDIKDIHEDEVNDLTFVGIVGMKDPLRPEAKEAIGKAQTAGIRVIMATGDHKSTALAIAREIGIVAYQGKTINNPYPEVIDGTELEKLSEKDFKNIVKHVSVFARLTPQMKLKIATELQSLGYIVAMTGDGVNDAAALKKADIGISMGIIGTDVARESSELVLADDNFASIISAVEEGRVIFNNTRRASAFLVTTTFASNATILSTLFIGMPLPFLPIQILYINLVTDTVSGATLATEKSHKNILKVPPRKMSDGILYKEMIPFIVLMVLLMSSFTVVTFSLYLDHGLDEARTAAFLMLAMTQLFNVFNLRSFTMAVSNLGLFTNRNIIIGFFISMFLIIAVIYLPFLANIFSFKGISVLEFISIFGFASLIIFFGEIYKIVVWPRSNT